MAMAAYGAQRGAQRSGHREQALGALGSQAGVCPSPVQEAPASLYSSHAPR